MLKISGGPPGHGFDETSIYDLERNTKLAARYGAPILSRAEGGLRLAESSAQSEFPEVFGLGVARGLAQICAVQGVCDRQTPCSWDMSRCAA